MPRAELFTRDAKKQNKNTALPAILSGFRRVRCPETIVMGEIHHLSTGEGRSMVPGVCQEG